MHLIGNFLGTALAVLVAAEFVPGFYVDGLVTSLIVAVLLGIVSITLRPILLLFTLPINILTLGLFSFVVNAGLVILAAYIVPGVDIDGFITALLFSIIVSLVNALFAPLRWV